MGKIYTIGYEGKTTDEFLKVLHQANVSIVIDIRENPNSRKKGFSQRALSEILKNDGILYEHIAELGTPKEIRNEYQMNGDIAHLLEQYRTYLSKNPEYIDNLLNTIGDDSACLMCFEKLPTQCHRFIVAEYLYIHQGMAINHL